MPANLAFPPAVFSQGPGGNGTGSAPAHDGGAGGGGGGIGGEPLYAGVAPGTVLTITIGAGGSGSATTVTGGTVTVQGNAGANGSGTGAGAAGGSAGSNTVAFPGGQGGAGVTAASGFRSGGGGGGGAGSAGAGGAGTAGSASASTGGTAGTGLVAGGTGGACTVGGGGNPGTAPGGGGSGTGDSGASQAGGGGKVTVTWVTWLPDGFVRPHVPASRTGFSAGSTGAPVQASGPVTPAPFSQPGKALRGAAAARKGTSAGSKGAPVTPPPVTFPAPFTAPHIAIRGRTSARKGGSQGSTGALVGRVPAPFRAPCTATRARSGIRRGSSAGSMGAPVIPPTPVAVNQWSGTFAQPAVFGSMPPALQSTVVALTPATSVGGGSGTPTAGNWLFCVAGWNQQGGASPVTVAMTDDIHSWWRPASPSSPSGMTRTVAWYTPNLARTADDVYVAPTGCLDGMAVLVIEVSGLGPWDTVAGVYANYAAAATSLNLALAAPGYEVFTLAGVCGDSSTASQAFTPAGWTALSTVTATNGTDHVADAVLTSACITTSSAVSVIATAGTATDLSGFIISVLVDGPSPIPAGLNPAWVRGFGATSNAPGRVICEIGEGAGFETPPDEIEWTSLNDSAANPFTTTKRLWGWSETTGIQYGLGTIQTTSGEVQLDNFDGELSPQNSASALYPDVATGLPVRLRAAIGGTVNRWYVLQRNMMTVKELRDKAQRNYVSCGLGDIWAAAAGACYTPYRGEIVQDSPGWWWPCDDQPGIGGVLPVTLRNAAPGNTNPLLITPSPGGVSYQDLYSASTGEDLTAGDPGLGSAVNPGIASYTVGANQGWMPGDPQSSPASGSAGGAITASPGSASWQQTGSLGSTGSHSWFLVCNDTYPPLSAGVTVEAWANLAWFGTSKNVALTGGGGGCVAGNTYGPVTLFELATNTLPVAILQLDINGALHLITYAAGTSTGTSHAIYSTSDLRCETFFSVSVSLTTTTWTVELNGGTTAGGLTVSGTCTAMTSAWTWFVGGADLGTSGGSSLSAVQHAGNMSLSHLSIYPRQLPLARRLSHYYAAITGCGQLPAPQALTASQVCSSPVSGYTPDGTLADGNYGVGPSPYGLSFVAASVAGSYTSGPSARAVMCGIGVDNTVAVGAAVWAGVTGLAPGIALYTSANAGAEKQAGTIMGAGNSYYSGYGSGASGSGVSQTAAGTGASPPAAASTLGDSVAQRIERICGYGSLPVLRSVDPASLPVQAALDVGGQQAGQGISNMAQSDSGLLGIDNMGSLFYRSRPHLAADPVVWQLGPDVSAGQIPYKVDQAFANDPQKVYNSIGITPYDPSGGSPPLITPSNASAVAASIAQYGPRPKTFTSYLQSQAEIQNCANWYLTTYGQNERRVTTLTVDAASHPAAWVYVLGANIGDIVSVSDSSVSGAPSTTGSYRITQMSRKISNGANGLPVTGSLQIVADPLPASYWS